MVVHRRVNPRIKFDGTHLYTWVERGFVRVMCLSQKHNTVSPAQTARSGENVSKKIACAIGAIKRIRHLTPFNVLIKVYNSLIQPHFDYCNVVWGNCNKGLSEKLQRLQNRAARILMSASYDSNLDDLFRALGWRRLHYQRLEQKSILMYKTLHGMTPDYLRSRFVYRDNARAYRLRNTENKLVLPQPRIDYLKRSFLYSGAQLWNNLPVDLRQASSLTDFKSKLSRHSLK